MIDLDEDALICDFAETYHIYDYRSLPVCLAATFAVGLRDDSRIKKLLRQKEDGQKVSNTELLLSVLIDRVGVLISGFGNGEPLPSYLEQCYDGVLFVEPDDGLQRFSSAEDFEAERHRLLRGDHNEPD